VDPSIIKMVEGLGLSIAVTFIDWLTPREREKTKFDSFGEITAEGFLRRGPLSSTRAAIEYFKEYCLAWKVDGMIFCFPYSCRPYTITPLMVKKAITRDLGIPVLVLEGDAYDTRDYSAEQLRTRVETFAEMLRAKKAVES
jgi:hypothetical protein